MNQTQSAFRLSAEQTNQPLETSRISNPVLRHPDGHVAPTAASDGDVSQPHVLRLHAPSGPRQSEQPAPPVPDRAAEEIVDGVLKAAHRLRGLLSGHFSEFDLTDVRYAVLRFLRDAEPHGCTQSEIAEHLDQSESSISTLVKRMRKSELLYRLRSGIDKRKWVLKLTARGSNLLETARRCHAERMDGFLRAFDSDERLNLTGMLGKLVAELTPQEDPPAPVMERETDGQPSALSSGSPTGPCDEPDSASTAGEAPAA